MFVFSRMWILVFRFFFMYVGLSVGIGYDSRLEIIREKGFKEVGVGVIEVTCYESRKGVIRNGRI